MFDFKSCAVGFFAFSVMYGLFSLNSKIERFLIAEECRKNGVFVIGAARFECQEIKLK
ncbi:hypothetical protein [Nitrosospira multiformis]|uniref:hypothetical protein n=1 Tax=Nitrosospira multiformis TaxID=1231 RepID=UPI001C31C633|nr:hypothetical protein [Nitrosospira multiformis]